jgi:hypothetical protein
MLAASMIKATFYVADDGPEYLQNRVFTAEYFSNGLKNYLFMFAELRRHLEAHGINLATQDIHPVAESPIVIAIDQVTFFQSYQRQLGQQLYLIINEPATYFPQVWERRNHVVFDRIFTYDYTLADGHDTAYVHHYFALDLADYSPPAPVSEVEFAQRKLLVLIAGMLELNKPQLGSPSLLYERYRTLRWFGQYLPAQFAFFSRGIEDKIYRSFPGLGMLQQMLPSRVTGVIANVVASLRRRRIENLNNGPVPAQGKLRVLRGYRFVLCYENSRLPGYVSEKIFDGLLAGSVPVYLGEPHIERFVPSACFVDRRAFGSDAELAAFLQGITYPQYVRYLAAAQQFLNSPEFTRLGSKANAWRIAEVVLAAAGLLQVNDEPTHSQQ